MTPAPILQQFQTRNNPHLVGKLLLLKSLHKDSSCVGCRPPSNSRGDVLDDFELEVEEEQEESPLPSKASLQEGATYLGFSSLEEKHTLRGVLNKQNWV